MKMLSLALALAALSLAAGPEADKSKALGNPSAPLRMDLYSDFTCPHCKMMHEQILPRIIADYVNTGKAYLVFHEYVLTGPGHEHSRTATLYADAAAKIGKYQQVSDALFAQQVSWTMTGKVWDTVAAALTPAERKKVQALYSDPSVAAEIQSDMNMGNAARVDRTPTMIITHKGRQTPWSWWENYSLFKSLVDNELKK